jgi:uncharacterized protein (TIGR02145 family)
MQQMTQEYCASMTVFDGANLDAIKTLKDTRNNQNYRIAKLADNNCWMLNNLKLGSTTGAVTLTNQDTDLNTITSFSLPQLYSGSSGNYWSYDRPYAFGAVPGDTSGEAGTTTSNAAITDDTFYGYLYNWTAAIASEGSPMYYGEGAPDSICPKGWRLPTADGTWNGSSYGSDFANLNTAMYSGVTTSGNYSDSAHAANWSSIWLGVYSGSWGEGFSSQGSSGNYWPSTTNSISYAYDLNFTSGNVRPDDSYRYRTFGAAVRCLATGDIAPASEPIVTFDTVQATVTGWNDTTIEAVAPPHAPGLVSVTVNNGVDTVILPAICKLSNGTELNLTTTPTNPLPTECNGKLDPGETRSSDRSNVISGFLYEEVYLSISLNTDSVEITDGTTTIDSNGNPTNSLTPTPSGTFGSASNTTTTSTNNPTGYTLSISTNQANTNPDTTPNPNAKDLKHVSLNQYITSTTNTCTWNSSANSLTNTDNQLSNNTWGFTLTQTNKDNQQLCQVPDKDNPLTIKTTATQNEAGDNTDIFFGARIDITRPSGKYEGTVVYTVVANM